MGVLGLLALLVAVGGRALSLSLFPDCGRYGPVAVQFAPPARAQEVESFLKFMRGHVPGIEWSFPEPESWSASRTVRIYPKPPTDRRFFVPWLHSLSTSPLIAAVDRDCAPRFNASGELVRQRRPLPALALEFTHATVLAVGAWLIVTRLR